MKKNIFILFILSFFCASSQPNITLVIDDSKSMEWNKLWNTVKQKSSHFLNSLPEQTKLDLHFYGDKLTSHSGLNLPDDLSYINSIIQAKNANGEATHTYKSIDEILNINVPDILFLFTDGKANDVDRTIHNLANTITRFENENSYLIIVRFGNEEILTLGDEALCKKSPNCIYLKDDYNFAIIEPKSKILEFNKDIDSLELSFYTYGTDMGKLNQLQNGLKIERTNTPVSIKNINQSIVTDISAINNVINPLDKNILWINIDNRNILDSNPSKTPHEIEINFQNTGLPDVFVIPNKIKATYSSIGYCSIDSLYINKSTFKGRENIKIPNVFDNFNYSGDCNSSWIEFEVRNIDSTQLKLNFQHGNFSYLTDRKGLWRLNSSDIYNIKINDKTCSIDVDFVNSKFSLKSLFQFSTPYNIKFEYSNSNLNISSQAFVKSILADSTKSQLKLKKTKSTLEWIAFILFLILIISILSILGYILFKILTKKTFHDGLITLRDNESGNIVASIATKNATRVFFGNASKYTNHSSFEKICGQKDAFHFFNSQEGYYIYADNIGFTYVLKTSDNPQQTLAIINHNRSHNLKNLTIIIN
jgi:hypothetical protein